MVPEKESSRFSRRLVNLFAAMADGSPHFPPILHQGGYEIHSIEKTFTALPGTKKVNPELMLCSDTLAHTLLIEAKSGANLSPDQLGRYASVTEQALRDSAYTTRNAAKSHNVLLIGKAVNESRLLTGSAVLPSERRVLSVVIDGEAPEVEDSLFDFSAGDDNQSSEVLTHGIRLVENQFRIDSLTDAFRPILPISWELVPVNYLPLDHEAEDWEFAERLIPELVIRIQAGDAAVKLDDLGMSIIGLWKYFVGTYKRAMIGKLERVIKLATQTRFNAYVKFGERGLPKNEVRFQVPPNLVGKPAQLRSNLARQSRAFLEDLNSPQIAMVFDPNSITID